jgi:hypothetical protein
MSRIARVVCRGCAALALGGASLSAQAVKSHSSGFFVGLGLEGTGISTKPSGGAATIESGNGGGLELGYGFSPRWALYGDVSGADVNGEGDDSYLLTHVDLGARVHFRTGPNRVVPFIQFGLAGRNEREDVGGHTVSANGAGVSLGAGLHAHFTPTFAFSASVIGVVGNFNNSHVDNTSVSDASTSATSVRMHLGLVWFPGA